MEHDHAARKLPETIKRLQEQRDLLHSSLGELLEEASHCGHIEHPQLVLEVKGLSELTDLLLTKIEDVRTELDRIAQASAEEFVKNYKVKPGTK
jgi:hypothetical protein